MITGLIIGFSVGHFVTIAVIGMLSAAGDSDRRMEKAHEDRLRRIRNAGL